MNPKSESLLQDAGELEEDCKRDEFSDDEVDGEQILATIASVSDEVKGFTKSILETGILDTSCIQILQSKQDWRYFKNKVVDETCEIRISDVNELWECSKHYFEMSEHEPDENSDEDIVAHNEIVSICGNIEEIIAHFIDQMSEEIIVEILCYCQKKIAAKKGNTDSTISLLLRTFEYETLPSKLVLPVAFGLSGVPFIKSYLIISAKYPEVPLNAHSFYKRITEVDDPIVFKALDCGSFSCEELMSFKAFEFAFTKIKEHVNNTCISKAASIKDEEWVAESLRFITSTCKKTEQQRTVAFDILEIAKDGSLYIKLETMKFFECFFTTFDVESIMQLLKLGLMSMLYGIVMSETKDSLLITSIKLLALVKDFLKSQDLSFGDINEFDEIDESELYETLSEISSNTSDELLQEIIESILPQESFAFE